MAYLFGQTIMAAYGASSKQQLNLDFWLHTLSNAAYVISMSLTIFEDLRQSFAWPDTCIDTLETQSSLSDFWAKILTNNDAVQSLLAKAHHRIIHQWLNHVYSVLGPKSYRTLVEHLAQTVPHQIRLYHQLQLKRLEGDFAPALVWQEAEKALSEPHFLHLALRHCLIEQAIRGEDLEHVERLVGHDLAVLNDHLMFGWLVLLKKNQHFEKASDILRAYLIDKPQWQGLRFAELKLLNEGSLGAEQIAEVMNQWPEFNEALKHNEALRNTFSAFTKPLKCRETLWDARVNDTQKDRLNSIILDAVETQKAFSLLRIGDAEAYAWPERTEKNSEDNDVRERRWWGQTLKPEQRHTLQEKIFSALNSADMVGVPSVYRLIRDLGAPEVFGNTPSQRGMAQILGTNHLDLSDKIVTDERVHQLIFDPTFVNTLRAKAKSVIWISCWSPEQMRLTLATRPEHHLPIAPHIRVAGQFQPQDRLYETYPDIMQQLTPLCEKGVLVFVSAGIVGKLFIKAARLKGAVALDIGAITDYWAGFQTRSLMDMTL